MTFYIDFFDNALKSVHKRASSWKIKKKPLSSQGSIREDYLNNSNLENENLDWI